MGNKNASEKPNLNLTNLKYIVLKPADIVSNNEDRLIVNVITVGGYKLSKTYPWHVDNRAICYYEINDFINKKTGKIGILIDTSTDVIAGLVKDNGQIMSCIEYLQDKILNLVNEPEI